MKTTHLRTTYSALAGLVALALVGTACGDDSNLTSSPGTTPGTSPVTADGLVPPRPVLVTGGGGSAAGSATATGEKVAADAASTEMATDSMMIYNPWKSLRFEATGQIELPTANTGWVYSGIVTPDLEKVAALAAALGVTGSVDNVPENEGGGWRVGPADGSAPSLWVAASGTLDWWYSPAWTNEGVGVGAAEPGIVIDEATPATGDAATTGEEPAIVIGEDTVTPETVAPPANVPDEATARAKAAEIWAAAGIDVSGLTEDVYVDEWQASVSYSSTDTTRPPVYVSIAFGGDGAVQWANGILGEPQAAGPFPLVDLATAVARLNEYYGFETTDDLPLLRDGGMATDAAATEGGAATSEIAVEPDTPVSSDTVAVDPMPEQVEAIDKLVSLVSAKAGTWSAWDADGSVWYVPAYEFTDTEGGIWLIPAVTDEYLIVDQPVAEPMDAEAAD